MEKGSAKTNSRRDFIRTIAVVSPAFFLGLQDLLAINSSHSMYIGQDQIPALEYKFRTFSVEHVAEVKEWFDKLKSENKLSDNKTFRSYIDNFRFNPEEIMPGAKSLIILSIPQRLTSLILNYKRKKYEILIPTGYIDDGIKADDIKNHVMTNIVKDSSRKLEQKVRLPLKTLGAKSGLTKYGKNNISYVDGYGSYHDLWGFYTDQVLEDNWGQMNMLRECNGCSICINSCPTKCFRSDNFVIDIGKCISLYNEQKLPIPSWIDPKAHNAAVGCLKCQYECPANSIGKSNVFVMPELTHDETEFLLTCGKDEQIKKSVLDKLSSRFPYVNSPEYIARNLNLVFKNTVPMK